MKRKNLSLTVLVAVVIALAASAVYAIAPSYDCMKRYDKSCASGADVCYFWVAGSDEACLFEFSVFN